MRDESSRDSQSYYQVDEHRLPCATFLLVPDVAVDLYSVLQLVVDVVPLFMLILQGLYVDFGIESFILLSIMTGLAISEILEVAYCQLVRSMSVRLF